MSNSSNSWKADKAGMEECLRKNGQAVINHYEIRRQQKAAEIAKKAEAGRQATLEKRQQREALRQQQKEKTREAQQQQKEASTSKGFKR